MHLFDIKIPSERQKKAIYQKMIDKEYSNTILAELVEQSPIIIQNSRLTHQAEKIWMYGHTTV